jgi:G3E family GTPase
MTVTSIAKLHTSSYKLSSRLDIIGTHNKRIVSSRSEHTQTHSKPEAPKTHRRHENAARKHQHEADQHGQEQKSKSISVRPVKPVSPDVLPN